MGGTVILNESIDINSLGVNSTPSPSKHTFNALPTPPPKETRRNNTRTQPPTPSIIPPTPSPPNRSSVRAIPNSGGGDISPSSSSTNDIFYDAEDGDVQSRRRSLYRSPGTSSSPDLATLLRKAKERGGVVTQQQQQQQQQQQTLLLNDPPPAVPSTPGTTRSRPPVSSPAALAPSKSKLKKSGGLFLNGDPNPSSSDWASNRTRDVSGTIKVSCVRRWDAVAQFVNRVYLCIIQPPRSSVRQKTSAFLGKMLGQGTVRERSVRHFFTVSDVHATDPLSSIQKTDASLPSIPLTSSMYDHVSSPPVPPLPTDIPRNHVSSSPIADVFSTQGTSKPLPRIVRNPENGNSDDYALSKPKLVPPTVDNRGLSDIGLKSPSHTKRRSMSIGEYEYKKVSSAAASPDHGSHDAHAWDSRMNGIISDFKGELSQLDPLSNSLLDLQDPSAHTPPRRGIAANATPTCQLVHVEPHSPNNNAFPPSPAISVTPTVILRPSSDAEIRSVKTPPSSPIYDANASSSSRNSSLQAPARANSPPAASQVSGSKNVPTLRSRNVNSFGGLGTQIGTTSRLRTQHRSTASSSEPSLVRDINDARIGERYNNKFWYSSEC